MRQKLSERMSRPVVTVSLETRVSEAARLALREGVHHLVVVDHDEVRGVLCVCDLHRTEPRAPVSRCMSTPVVIASVNDTVEEATRRMRAAHVGCLPLTAGGLLMGIVTIADLVGAGVALEDLGRVPCAVCGSSRHVRPDARHPAIQLCLYCRERAADQDVGELGGGD